MVASPCSQSWVDLRNMVNGMLLLLTVANVHVGGDTHDEYDSWRCICKALCDTSQWAQYGSIHAYCPWAFSQGADCWRIRQSLWDWQAVSKWGPWSHTQPWVYHVWILLGLCRLQWFDESDWGTAIWYETSSILMRSGIESSVPQFSTGSLVKYDVCKFKMFKPLA